MSKWSSEKICRFLEIYEKYDMLWNVEAVNYRDRPSREEGMRNLLQELEDENFNTDLDEVRKKIKTIRTVYSEELRKIQKSRKINSAGEIKIYKPKLQWFQTADSFLRNVATTRNSISNLDIKVEHFQMEENVDENSQDEEEVITPKRAKLTKPIDPLAGFPKKMPTAPLDPIQDLNTRIEDELDHFGKYVTATLRKLPAINALRCQEKIHSIINQERIAVLSPTNRTCKCQI